MIESLILDPPEFAPGRVPLSLHELGLEVGENGADWGESQVAVQLARQQIGSTVTDRHLEAVEMSIPLVVMDGADVNLAEAAYPLQQKVGLMQADEYEPAWLMREFSTRVGAAGAVGYMIHSAALHGLQGRAMAHSGVAPDVTLKCLRSPLCYATEEIASEVFSAEGARVLEWELDEVKGTAPGLFRLRVKNTGDDDWRAVIVPMESRDHPQDAAKDTTAALIYEAEDLTLSGGAEVKGRTGASGGSVVRASLTAGWLAILSSGIDGVGHMTHVGGRRLRVRIYDPGVEAGGVELRAQYRSLGTVNWSDTFLTVPTPLVDDFAQIDLGELKAERAVLGDQRWEWRILARAPSGAGSIDLDLVFVEPLEQHVVVRAPDNPNLADSLMTKSPGTVANDASIGDVAWSNPSNAKTSDNSRAKTGVLFDEKSQLLKATDLGFEIPEPALTAITGVQAKVEGLMGPGDGTIWVGAYLVKGGAIASPLASGKFFPTLQFTDTSDAPVILGSASNLYANTLTPAEVNDSGFGVAIIFRHEPPGGISEGRVVEVDDIDVLVYFATGTNANRVCYSSRSGEFRSDGVHFQHPTDDVWGEWVNEGFNLYAPPSYMEGRAVRGLVIPSQGDLGVLPDSGDHDLEAQTFYRPGYHFAREAVS